MGSGWAACLLRRASNVPLAQHAVPCRVERDSRRRGRGNPEALAVKHPGTVKISAYVNIGVFNVVNLVAACMKPELKCCVLNELSVVVV